MTIDHSVVLTILAFAGVGVAGATEMLKRMLKWDGFKAYLISFVVSAAATIFTLVQMAAFAWLPVVVYTIVVFMEANGIYKIIKK